MDKLTISIFGDKIFSEIIKEIKLFSKFRLKFYNNLDLCIKDSTNYNQLAIFLNVDTSIKNYDKLKKNVFPSIIVTKWSTTKVTSSNALREYLTIPFRILDLEKKIVSLLARYKFKKGSFINLHSYTIDKNERKIKKGNLVLKLTEKEISFLILFSKNKKPLSRSFILKNVWKYSSESDTHTVETHIHRLRKKFLEKFSDSDFIKNNEEGYYIWKKKPEILLLETYFLQNIKKE